MENFISCADLLAPTFLCVLNNKCVWNCIRKYTVDFVAISIWWKKAISSQNNIILTTHRQVLVSSMAIMAKPTSKKTLAEIFSTCDYTFYSTHTDTVTTHTVVYPADAVMPCTVDTRCRAALPLNISVSFYRQWSIQVNKSQTHSYTKLKLEFMSVVFHFTVFLVKDCKSIKIFQVLKYESGSCEVTLRQSEMHKWLSV